MDANATSYRIQIATEITFLLILLWMKWLIQKFVSGFRITNHQLNCIESSHSNHHVMHKMYGHLLFSTSQQQHLLGDCVIGLILVATVAYDFESGSPRLDT